MISIDTLAVTQRSIRSLERVGKMVKFVKAGGIFVMDQVKLLHPDEDTFSLVKITRFKDFPQLFIHDGHHRCTACILGGRGVLREEEYEYLDFDSIERYQEVNLDAGWVTPLDLRESMRVPDIRAFKRDVLSLPPEMAVAYIENHASLYKEPRNGLWTVRDLIRELQLGV